MSDDKKYEEVVDKILNEPVSVTSVEDGWVFSFSATLLKELLEQANDNEKQRAIIVVRSREKMI